MVRKRATTQEVKRKILPIADFRVRDHIMIIIHVFYPERWVGLEFRVGTGRVRLWYLYNGIYMLLRLKKDRMDHWPRSCFRKDGAAKHPSNVLLDNATLA